MILAITGTAPTEVRGEGAALLDHLSDFAHVHMRFPGGLRSHLFTSRLNPYRERRLTVVGTQAMAVFDDVEPWARKLAVYRHAVWQDSGQWAFTANEPSYAEVEEGMPLTRELEHFIRCIETGESPRTTGEEAVLVLKILTAGSVTHRRIGPSAAAQAAELRRGAVLSRDSIASASAPRSERAMKPPPSTRAASSSLS
jgi:predicted dehydrogenase